LEADLKTLRHILFALLAATVLGSVAVGGVSCRGAEPSAPETVPSPDTLALVAGLQLFEEGQYDLARDSLRVSARSGSTYIRAESFLYLNALEMELGNYEVARPWLERYHAETVRLLRSAAEASAHAAEQASRDRRRNDTLTLGAIVAMAVVAAVTLWRKRRSGVDGAASPKESASAEPTAVSAEWERWLADTERFRQSPLWDEIAALAAQKPGREARVMTLGRQDALDDALDSAFGDFAEALRTAYPTLTAGDIKLCELSLLPLSSFGKALCYGSTETNIIKQRKHTIKKKLADPRGRALFDFIFAERQ
jgi:hypothetical protein